MQTSPSRLSPPPLSLRCIPSACLLFGTLLGVGPAFGTIIGTEPFDYPDAPIAGQSGGTGWDYLRTAEPGAGAQSPSDWDDITPAAAVSGGTLQTTGSSAKREFGGPVEGSAAGSNEREGAFRGAGTVYFSVEYSVSGLLAAGTNQWGGFSSYDFGTERLFFGMPGQTTAVRYFGISGQPLSTIPVETGVTYHLIGAVDFDNDRVKLWVNPDSNDFDNGLENSADVSGNYTGTNWSSAVRLGSGAGFTTTWDNLQVADTLADLLPPPSGVVVSGLSLNALEFRAEFTDAAGAVFDVTKPVSVTVGGTTFTPAATKSGGITTLTYSQTPPAVFPNGLQTVVIAARDTQNRVIDYTGTVTTRAHAGLDAAWKAADGTVDLNQRGFRATLHQLPFSRYPKAQVNNLPLPERQLAWGYAHRLTGEMAENLVEPGLEPDGSHPVTFGIDWDIATNSGHFPGQPIPNFPGSTGSTDHAVAEFSAWLELPAGMTRLGVASDDGFTFSSGRSPLDHVQRVVLAQFNGGRGAGDGDTTIDLIAPSAGLYPVRLLWWQGTGGASVELFSIQPDGSRILVDDPTNDLAIKAWHTGRLPAPSLHLIAPYPGSTENGARHPIRIELLDGVATVTDATISLSLDGTVVTPVIARPSTGTVRITLDPPGGAWAPLSTHTVALTWSDSAGTARTETWTFTTAPDPLAIVGADPFDYPDGPLGGASGGTGWTSVRLVQAAAQPPSPSTWNEVTGTPSTAGGALQTNGSAIKREYGGATEGADPNSNEYGGAFAAGGTVYFGMDWSLDTLLPEASGQWSGFSSYDFGTERLFFGMPNQTTAQRFFGITGSVLAGPTLSTIPVEAGVPYRLAGAIDYDSGLVKLWVNPDAEDYDDGASHSADVSVVWTGTNWSSAIRLGSAPGATTTWDNLTVAQRFEDVLGSSRTATLAVLNFTLDRAAGSLGLTWESTPGQVFTVEYSRDLTANSWQPLGTGIGAGPGSSTTWQTTAAGNPAMPSLTGETILFFRARATAAP